MSSSQPLGGGALPPFGGGALPPFGGGALPPFGGGALPPFGGGALPPFGGGALPPFGGGPGTPDTPPFWSSTSGSPLWFNLGQGTYSHLIFFLSQAYPVISCRATVEKSTLPLLQAQLGHKSTILA